MKPAIILSLISCTCIFAYWYFDIATDGQRQFVKDKVTTTGQSITSKGKEIYENRDEYIDKAKEIVNHISETTSQYVSSHYYAGQPVSISYPNPITVLKNKGFTVGYDEVRKNPAWVCYRLFEDTIEKDPKRPSRFSVDTRTTSQVSHNDYTHSGYDLCLMAPNYAITQRYGVDAQKETFFMSNIVPQRSDLNQGPWRELEEDIGTKWANKLKEVWVVTGPIYDEDRELLKSGVEIPDFFFKIVLDEKPDGGLMAAAFILKEDMKRSDDYRDCAGSVDLVENLSGFDFFSELDDEVEKIFEGEYFPGWSYVSDEK